MVPSLGRKRGTQNVKGKHMACPLWVLRETLWTSKVSFVSYQGVKPYPTDYPT